jgi:Bacterial Ig domain/Concanavalin A-like lectin/glucanases superfamily
MPAPMAFNGTSGSVLELPHAPIYAIGEGTIAFSFTAANTSGLKGLFAKDATGTQGGGNHVAVWLGGSTLTVRQQNSASEPLLTFAGIVAGQEYKVATTFGPDGAKLFVDGVLVASNSVQMDWTSNVEYLQWGGLGWASPTGSPGYTNPFNGTIADKQIYGVALSQSQIAQLHAAGPVNADPNAVNDVLILDEDTSATFDPTVNDSDPDGDEVTVEAIATGPANGTAAVNPDGTVTYTPDADFFGADAFELVVSDGRGGFSTSLVSVTVNNLDDDPVAIDDAVVALQNTPVVIDVLANDFDADGDTLIVQAAEQGAFGSVAINPDGTVTYTPNQDFLGEDSFEYTISDGDGTTSSATVTVEVAVQEPIPAPIFARAGIKTYTGSSGDVDNIPHSPLFAIAEGTVALSFKDGNPSVRQGLVVKDAFGYTGGGNHFAAYVEQNQLKVRFQDGSSELSFSQPISPNVEYEVAAVFGANGVALYVDGDLVDSDEDFVMSWGNNQEYLQIGGLGWGSPTGGASFTNPFSGEIADLEIYGDALDLAQIQLLAQQSSFDLV